MANEHSNSDLQDKAARAFYKMLSTVIPRTRAGDRLYSYIRFTLRHKRRPTQEHLFNDMFYKIKTSDEILDPLRVLVTDKELVKIYIKAEVGDEYNIPTIGVLKNENDVDSFIFPANCCIKPTHSCGHVIFRENGNSVDRARIKSWFKNNYYIKSREANYKNLRPKVIVEPIIFNNINVDDYKFFCFNGVPRLVQVDFDRYVAHKRIMVDMQWNLQEYIIGKHIRPDMALPKPMNFCEMAEVAAKLAARFSGLVRVDLYSDQHSCLVGEITNCHGNAGSSFVPRSGEQIASEIIFY